MMASGMNGQVLRFTVIYPLKRGKKVVLKSRENFAGKNQSQIFIETPYRNNKMLEDILQALHPETYLCIATDITLPTEYIKTKRICLEKKSICTIDHFIIHKM
jgi:16S rRNA (cytidine1402-2'-O)-methyltransferase